MGLHGDGDSDVHPTALDRGDEDVGSGYRDTSLIRKAQPPRTTTGP